MLPRTLTTLGTPRAVNAQVFWPLLGTLAENTTQDRPDDPLTGRPLLQTMLRDGVWNPHHATGAVAATRPTAASSPPTAESTRSVTKATKTLLPT